MNDDDDDLMALVADMEPSPDYTGRVSIRPVYVPVDSVFVRAHLPRVGVYDGPAHVYGFMHMARPNPPKPLVFRPGLRLSAHLTPYPGNGWREVIAAGRDHLAWVLRWEARMGAAFSGESVDTVLAYLRSAVKLTVEEYYGGESAWAVAEAIEAPTADVLLPLGWGGADGDGGGKP